MLSRIQGYCYHLSKFHIYALVYCISVFLSGLLHSVCETAKETEMYRTVFWTLWEKARVRWYGRMALKHVNYHMWNESPVQVWCMIQGAWGWSTGISRGMGWGGKREWGSHVHPWWIQVNVWEKQYNIVK